jgi:regulator of protease activity HflC (stomatin/prohibitin superfamily)
MLSAADAPGRACDKPRPEEDPVAYDKFEVVEKVRRGFTRSALGVIVVAAILALGSCTIATVDTGHVGVLTLFGRVTGEQLPEGIHLINPLKKVTSFSVRTLEAKEVAEVPSSEGLLMHLETSLLYRLDPQRATDVYQTLGTDYLTVVIVPNMRSVMRAITSAHTASALYSEGRDRVAQEMLAEMRKSMQPRGIVIENVLLRDVGLPATLKAAIEAKQQAEQDAQRMNFVLQKERQEAERKRIEAQGISDFQRIVTQGISQPLLDWKGIEATMEIAKSPNSKVVVIGNTKNGLPVIFSGQ